MKDQKAGDPWPRSKRDWLASMLQDVEESAHKLGMESQTLLYSMSELFAKHREQVKQALESHESQIKQAKEDMKFPSLSRVDSLQSKTNKSRWVEGNQLHLPNCLDDGSASALPTQPGPQQMPIEAMGETSSSTASASPRDQLNRDITGRSLTSAHIRDMLPEYMRGRHTLMNAWKTQTGKISFGSVEPGLPWYAQTHAQNCLSSKPGEAVVTVAILSNAIFVGVEADWSMKNARQDASVASQVVNTLFSAFFTLELLLRIYAYRLSYFSRTSKDFSWNAFDAFLVLAGIVDGVMSLLVTAPNFTVIRVLRLFRLVRVLRVVRVLRFFHDLRVIVAGIAGSMKSMLWAVGLLFMMMYIVSVCLMQLTLFELENLDPVKRDIALSYYGSIIQTIYTLYLSITGGLDWGDAAKPLLDINPFLACLYSFYIAFAVLCVLNIITGVFVDNASHVSIADEEQLVIDTFENRVKWFEEVKQLFSMMASGDTGELDPMDFQLFLDDVKVQACFRRLGIDVHETSKNGLFQLLDFDETGMVDLEEFALGLQMLHGSAKSIDMARIRCELKKMKRDLHSISRNIKDHFAVESPHTNIASRGAASQRISAPKTRPPDLSKPWTHDYELG